MIQQQARRGRDASRRLGTVALLGVVALAATRADAVILADSPVRNTTAPTDGLSTPWNLQGQFGSFLGTPIAPNLFIAAKHIGGGVGQTFTLGGQSYTTINSTDIASSDLRVYQIDTLAGTHAFNSYATLYDAGKDGSEVGKSLFVTGRGTQRGDAYVANGTQRGWLWGTADGVQSYGTSTVSMLATDDKLGDFVAFDFTSPGGVALSSGDSSGGLFVFAENRWELAGINYGVDGGWSASPDGPFVNASVYDARGLYVGTASDSDLVPTGGTVAIAASSYASRISSNRAAINVIFLATGNASLVPEPSTLAAFAVIVISMARRRRSACRDCFRSNDRATSVARSSFTATRL